MKIKPRCIPCLLNRVIYEAKLSTHKEEMQERALKAAIEVIANEYNGKENSAELATKVHRAVYKSLQKKDPYQKLKKEATKVALSLLPRVEDIIRRSPDPIEASALASIVANSLDFGIAGGIQSPNLFAKNFFVFYQEGLGSSDLLRVKKILNEGGEMLCFTDNCGEIVFDKSLCKEIKRFNQEINLTLVVKGEPILNDASYKDLEGLGFEQVVDEILDTGCFAIGLDFNHMRKKLKEKLKRTKLIICKGMANYEAFSDTNYRPIVYLLRTKCESIAESMDLPLNINAIKLYE
jgi:hypothetical protein